MLNRFRHEIFKRREKLAFLMDKVYYIKKHEEDIYSTLADTGVVARMQTAGGGTDQGGKTTVNIVDEREYLGFQGDKVYNNIMKKELPNPTGKRDQFDSDD